MLEALNHLEKHFQELIAEMKNFQEIAQQLVPSPGEVPVIPGVDIYGELWPLSGVVGGDHIIYIDFNKRYDLNARIQEAVSRDRLDLAAELAKNKARAGILLADVSGHRFTDALLAAMLHQAFLLGVLYELDIFGNVTPRLIENINTRFFQSSSVGKYLTLIYGEINSDGQFRFISAAHPPPVVFSNEFNRFADVGSDGLLTFPPIGTMSGREDVDARVQQSLLGKKENYKTNEINLMGKGDILILYSDGFAEHENKAGELFFETRLLDTIISNKGLTAKELFFTLKRKMTEFGEPSDDISFVIIKKTE